MYNDLPPDPISRVDVLSAYRFIRTIVELGVSFPSLMFGDDGSVGMYWDNDIQYADVEIESNNTLINFQYDFIISLFSRDRADGHENYIEFKIDEVNKEWVEKNLSAFMKGNK
jgi:hypothetical protein